MRVALLLVISLGMLSGCATVAVEIVTLQGAKITAKNPAPPPPVIVEKKLEEPSPVKVAGDHLDIDEKIQFVTWSAALAETSYPILDQVAKVLEQNDQIRKIEIQGHTAHTGKAKKSMKLSLDRANSVRDYLVRKGVSTTRLIAKGYGETKPIADNDTPEGREKNRRVEFVLEGVR